MVASATSKEVCCMLHVALGILEYCAWNTATCEQDHRPTGNVLALDSSPEWLSILQAGWIVGFVCGLLMANEKKMIPYQSGRISRARNDLPRGSETRLCD